MNVLHYSDHHDDNLKNLFNQADVFFSTGDLSLFDLTSIEKDIKLKPCFGVYGNHCVPGYLEQLEIQNVHLKVITWNSLKIGGFQGCLRYKESGGPQFTEVEASMMLANFPAVDILLLHAPPFGLLDDPNDPIHTGSESVRNYIDRHHPKFVFCGHLDPSQDLAYNGMKIFRTDKARIISI